MSELTKKHARMLLLIFGSIITGYMYIAPGYLSKEATQAVVEGRDSWMPIYTMIVIFYFRKQTEAEDKG